MLEYTWGQGGESMKIGEFSKLVGLPISTLWYYEDQGFLHIERQNGIRNYHAEDVGFVQFIKRLEGYKNNLEDKVELYENLLNQDYK